MNELYRYRPFNENTLRELLEGDLWHSHVRLLNDPFEHPFEFNWDEITLETLPSINQHLKLIPNDVVISSYIDSSEDNKERCFEGLRQWLVSVVDELKKNADRTFVCCFSKTNREPLMWSHYADGMTGLCFVYDKSVLYGHSKLRFKDAVYNKSVEQYTYRDLETTDRLVGDKDEYNFMIGRDVSSVRAGSKLSSYLFAYQKHERWAYEEEVRSVLFAESDEENAKAGVVESVSAEAIIGVIIGSKMNKTNRKIITALCKDRGIPIHLAVPSKKDYSVDIHLNLKDPIGLDALAV